MPGLVISYQVEARGRGSEGGLITNCQPSTVNYQLSTVNCQQKHPNYQMQRVY